MNAPGATTSPFAKFALSQNTPTDNIAKTTEPNETLTNGHANQRHPFDFQIGNRMA
jgi:hypothetical protein